MYIREHSYYIECLTPMQTLHYILVWLIDLTQVSRNYCKLLSAWHCIGIAMMCSKVSPYMAFWHNNMPFTLHTTVTVYKFHMEEP